MLRVRTGYRPSLLDHIPKTRRGHGTMHPHDRVSKDRTRLIRRHTSCVQATCAYNMAASKDGKPHGEPHIDQQANANDWKTDHGHHVDTPFEECFR